MEINPANSGQHAHTILLCQLTRLDGAIEKEFTLIADRMTWMMLSEAFIFGAFAASVMSYSQKAQLRIVSVTLMIVLPLLGMATALLVRTAINAAHIASDALKRDRTKVEDYFEAEFHIALISNKAETHRAGNLPSRVLPLIVPAIWATILVITVVRLAAIHGLT